MVTLGYELTPMKTRQGTSQGQVRIIAGKWRNTRLTVPSVAGLRPSADRMRETLFNWLQPMLAGATVLDVFAGTGALGIEALSRGASASVFIERDALLARSLKDMLKKLDAGDTVTVFTGDALQSLQRLEPASFDLAFVDPPFAAGLWAQVWPLLEPCMKPDAWLYVESPPNTPEATPPAHWRLHREMSTRDASGCLYKRQAAT